MQQYDRVGQRQLKYHLFEINLVSPIITLTDVFTCVINVSSSSVQSDLHKRVQMCFNMS